MGWISFDYCKSNGSVCQNDRVNCDWLQNVTDWNFMIFTVVKNIYFLVMRHIILLSTCFNNYFTHPLKNKKQQTHQLQCIMCVFEYFILVKFNSNYSTCFCNNLKNVIYKYFKFFTLKKIILHLSWEMFFDYFKPLV